MICTHWDDDDEETSEYLQYLKSNYVQYEVTTVK